MGADDGGSGGCIEELGPGLLALANPYPVDGRVSWHPQGARGYAAALCYLVLADDEALLVDTGLPVHEDSVLEQIRSALPAGSGLSIVHTRTGDFNCIGNTVQIVREFEIGRLYGSRFGPSGEMFSFRPGRLRLDPDRDKYLSAGLASRDSITLGSAGKRVVDAYVPELRLINTHWLYDRSTGTLFSSDFFSFVIRNEVGGPWVVRDEGELDLESVDEHLLATRYWWLDGAWSEPLRADLEEFFSINQVKTIAPAYGAVISGARLVEQVVERTIDVIASVGHSGVRPKAEGIR